MLNGLYGSNGWCCAGTDTLGLSELLEMGWYMYITALSIELLGLSGSDCQDCQILFTVYSSAWCTLQAPLNVLLGSVMMGLSRTSSVVTVRTGV